MKKNDKLVVILGVIILVIASLGIYYWVPTETKTEAAEAEDFVGITGSMKNIPTGILVSDCSPFYPLIATPVALHYNKNCEMGLIPLLIENITEPSTAVTKAIDMLNLRGETVIDGSKTPKELSLDFAKTYWKKSEGALIIENNQSGYELGVLAVPLASYLSIPVIVTDKIDSDVRQVLNELEVEYTLICGENIEDYGNVLRFESPEHVADVQIEIVMEKFGEVDYITLCNPIDAWPPEVLDSKKFSFGPETIKSTSMNKITKGLAAYASGAGASWKFTIPKDYKYVLVKFEGVNHEVEGVEEFGDSAGFNLNSDTTNAPNGLIITGSTASGGNPVRDASGKIVKDRILQEAVLYDQGGVEVTVKSTGSWTLLEEGKVSANVVIEKLENPVYPLMKGLSAVAPYLTAYHKGIVFGKTDFAFTADDDVITDEGKTCPGFYVPRRNPALVPLLNKHIFDNIHDPLNSLLAKLADVTIENDGDIEFLRNHYKDHPVYIALVGGNTVLPNYIYQNWVEPVGDIDGDGDDDTPYWTGGGTPSDTIYGNIDPIRYDWSNLANDIYSEYPFLENIVGRITGWDTQDTSAFVCRNIFYDYIVDQLEGWRDNFALLVGGGQDFQKPLVRHILFTKILPLHGDDPMKVFTGYSEQCLLRTKDQVAEPLGFNVLDALYEEAMREGLSDEAIDKIKQATLFNKLFFNARSVKRVAGEGVAKGEEIMEASNFIWANGHGCQQFYGMAGNALTATGLFGPIIQKLLEETIVPALGGFQGPGSDLGNLGDYQCREVSNMDLGPSFMWLESCTCGKLDGMFPKVSITQNYLHSGITSMIASSTGSNIGGGYLDPKNIKYDLHSIVTLKYLKGKLIDWENGNYDPPHFAYKIYTDLCEDLRENDVSIGLAFRNARNNYLTPEEINWEVWWSPPLVSTGDALLDMELNRDNQLYYNSASASGGAGKGIMLESKYFSFQEYLLYGDPALNLYEPCNEGK